MAALDPKLNIPFGTELWLGAAPKPASGLLLGAPKGLTVAVPAPKAGSGFALLEPKLKLGVFDWPKPKAGALAGPAPNENGAGAFSVLALVGALKEKDGAEA